MINHIGIRIKQLRILKGMSQQELCSDLLNRTILSHIENNKMYPSIPQLEYIAVKLGVNLTDFFECNNFSYNHKNEELPQNIYEILYNKKKYDDILQLAYKKSSLDYKMNILNYFFIGMSFFNLDIFSSSLTHLRRFIYNYTKSSSDTQKILCIQAAIALNTLFKIMLRNKNFEKGIRYLSLAKKYIYLFNIIDSEISFIIHSNLAYAYTKKAKFQNNITLLESLLSYTKNLVYTNIIPDIHLSLNIAHYNIGNYAASLEHVNKCKFFYEYIGKTELAALTNLNIINIYRYSTAFDKAFLLVEKCKIAYRHSSHIYLRFLMQECILLFNNQDFNKARYILDNINFKDLTYKNRKDYMFMKGHISFKNNDYTKSKNYFRKCIKYFIDNNYNYDLSLIYSDLYCIENDLKYVKLISDLKSESTEKNILVDWLV